MATEPDAQPERELNDTPLYCESCRLSIDETSELRPTRGQERCRP